MTVQAAMKVPGGALPAWVGQLASVAGMSLALVAGWWLGADAGPHPVAQRALMAPAATSAPAPAVASTQMAAPTVATPTSQTPASVAAAVQAPVIHEAPPVVVAPAEPAPAEPAPAIQAAATGPCVLLRARFGANATWLHPDQLAQVEAAARWLATHPGPVAVRGFADALGAADHNLRLSHTRATLVRDVLLRGGVPKARMTVQALGAYAPLTGVDADDARNRRVELWLPEGGCPATPLEED